MKIGGLCSECKLRDSCRQLKSLIYLSDNQFSLKNRVNEISRTHCPYFEPFVFSIIGSPTSNNLIEAE